MYFISRNPSWQASTHTIYKAHLQSDTQHQENSPSWWTEYVGHTESHMFDDSGNYFVSKTTTRNLILLLFRKWKRWKWNEKECFTLHISTITFLLFLKKKKRKKDVSIENKLRRSTVLGRICDMIVKAAAWNVRSLRYA